MRLLRAVLLLALLICAARAYADSPAFTGYTVKETRTETVAEGVVYSRYVLAPPDENYSREQRVHVIEVSPEAQKRVRLLAVPSCWRIHKGLRTLPVILNEFKDKTDGVILGGVNADFFDMTAGGSMGVLKSREEWLNAGEFPDGWVCGMTEEGQLLIGQPKVEMTLTMPDGEAVRIDALNALRADSPKADSSPNNAKVARRDNQLVLYTPMFGNRTFTQSGGVEAVIRPDSKLTGAGSVTAEVVRIIRQKERGGRSLQEGTMVLSGVQDGAELLKTLKAGDTVSIDITVQPPFDRAVTMVGGGRPDGGPLLMWEGALQDLEAARALADDVVYFYRHHPRTVVATREDGSYFLLAVEGNRAGCFGMTLEEMQTLLTDLGAYTALNLDGGPSTTMAVRINDKIKPVTDTTGGKGRLTQVGSALVIVDEGGQ